ncbi:MAG: DUF4911 domain-containing protein [Myxococcota bacterium]|nr:DUF4911 domain-containing protein [Myxococcota bacterium]
MPFQTKMLLRSIRIDKRHIGYVKWLLESHDGMATPTTRQGSDDVIDLLVAPDFKDEFELLLTALSEEIEVEIVDPPSTPPLGG